MAPKKHHNKSAASAEQSQRDRALRRILEDASQLQRQSGVVTAREVKSLREAFEAAVPINMRSSHQLAIQCDNLLHSLEKDSFPGSPETAVGTPAGDGAAPATAAATAATTASSGDASKQQGGKSAAASGKKASAPSSPLMPATPTAEKAAAARINGSWGDDSNINWKFTDIPLERRIQTFVITICCFFTGLPLVIGFNLLMLYFEITRWFMVAYIIYIVVAPVKHPLPVWRWWIDCSFFKYARDYFPVRLVIPKAIRKCFDARRNYLVCYHPHGVHSFGAVLSMGSNANGIYDILPGLEFHVQTLGIQFMLPFWRELVRWAGMGDASSKTIETTLTSGPGQSVVLVVGGAEESLLAAPRTNDLLISKRKGFVKIALRTGAALVPVFGFGETDVYEIYQAPPWLKAILLRLQKSFGFAFPLVKGRGWFNYNWGPLPHRKLIVTVFGEPIDVPQITKPSQQDIDHWHGVYVQKLMELYSEHKAVYDLHAQSEAQVVK